MPTAKKSSGAKKAAAKKSSAKTASKGAAKKGAAKGGAKKAAAKAPAKKGAAKGGAKKATAAKKAPAAKKSGAKRALNPALAAPMKSSEQLQAIVGNQPIPRSEITKRIWAYIKKNGLQDQQNRRAINADDKLRPIFGGKAQVSMFEMTALVNKHMQPA